MVAQNVDASDAKAWARSKLEQLTLEEKVLLLAGEDLWRTAPIPRLGISRLKTSDGPVGVRGGLFADGVRAASLPTGVSLAATWDTQLIEELSHVIISEARSKEVDVVLGPTVCIPRNPLGGRNFEAYSEDPLLTGKLASAFIRTLQSAGIAACVKHYAANDQEHRRFFIDENIPPRALREIHLLPFQIAVRESDPWSIMTAYNKINGTFCSAHEHLIQEVLRGEWGWDGLVMSDWFGTNSVVPSLTAGLDLEMPGPVRRRGENLLDAHRQGLVDTSFIDASASRVLELVHKTGKYKLPNWKERPEKAIDLPEHRALLRHAGAEGIVLLKNDKGILPLRSLDRKKIAVLGPNATRSVATGGGSSNLEPHYRTTPFPSLYSGIRQMCASAKIKVHPGFPSHRFLPLMNPSIMKNPSTGESGFVLSFWKNTTHSGKPVLVEDRPSSHLICYDGLPAELTTGQRYSYRARSIVTPTTSGKHQLSLSTCGPGKLVVDGKVVIDIERHWWSPKSPLFMSYGSPEERVEVYMEAGQEYEIVLESVSREPKPYKMDYMAMLEREEIQDGGRIGFLEDQGDLDKYFQDAVDLARNSDIVIVVVGKDAEWETETSDMESMDLPGRSNELISAVAAVNPNVIVVNQTGSAITMPWVDEVPTIVQAWYQGQEQGNAMTDVLLGKVNPCGKLPITFPKRIEDTPSYDTYPGDNDVTYYSEGIYVGYRYFDHRKIEPLFPFGAGLSYTVFKYKNIRLCDDRLSPDGQITVLVDVVNVGGRDGKEIVQFYVSQDNPRLARPPKELKGWDKVLARQGETVTARAILDKTSVSYWDDSVNSWVMEANASFRVTAAKDSRDPGLTATFSTTSDAFTWIH